MPTYDYVCTACGHEYELFQKMSDEPKKRCPKCRSKVERKIGTGAGLIFKGSGFYITDYRSEDYKKKVKSESSSGDSGGGSGAGDSSGGSGTGDSGGSSSSGSSSGQGSGDSGRPNRSGGDAGARKETRDTGKAAGTKKAKKD